MYVRVGAKAAQLIAGEIDLSDFDDEEILRGQARTKAGDFRGGEPTIVPRAIYQEFARRQMEAGFTDMIGHLQEIVRVVLDIATDPDNEPSVKLRAAEMIMDRIYGKPKAEMQLALEPGSGFEEVLAATVINRDEFDKPWDGEEEIIVDAEVEPLEDEFDWE
jgi:hypothetical protein